MIKKLFYAACFVIFLLCGSYYTALKEFKNAAYTMHCTATTCDVYFTNKIYNETIYQELYTLLQYPGSVSKVYFHLSGLGGDVSSIIRLANAIATSKVEVDTVIEGPVYSAHAFIAMLGKHKTIMPYAFFMFHSPGMYSNTGNVYTTTEYCKRAMAGLKDRGQDAVAKCLAGVVVEDKLFYDMFDKYVAPYLTSGEVKAIKDGYDVYITGDVMGSRLDVNVTH